MSFIRYQAAKPNQRGAHVGIFGLANGLARSGRLSPADQAWLVEHNAWFDQAYPDPATVDPTLFDKQRWPRLTCWFRSSAGHLLARVPGYLDLLDRYQVAWQQIRSDDPGVIRYADPVQVLVTPHPMRDRTKTSQSDLLGNN